MNVFVENPNLPLNVKDVLIGERYYNSLSEPLKKLGINPIIISDNPLLPHPVSSHADLSICHAGGERLFIGDGISNSDLIPQMKKMGAETIAVKSHQSDRYPGDTALNVCALGKTLICSKYSDNEIVEHFRRLEYKIIRVKQAYCRCSVCIVNSDAIITADTVIASECEKSGIDVLLICPGHIALEGYDYGFIGGSSFKISSDKLAFTGRFEHHPCGEKIINFLTKHNVQPVFLTDEAIFDIGTAIPLSEK